eukprot:4549113-Pyramimonas_sp.AAC.1
MVLYFPPRPSSAAGMRTYLARCRQLSSWAQGQLKKLPSRFHPIVLADVNDGVGLVKKEGEWMEVETEAVGRIRTKERHAGGGGQRFRELLESADLFSPTTLR